MYISNYFNTAIWSEQKPEFVKSLNKQEVKDLKRKRNSDLVWLNDTWIYKELHPYVHEANARAVGTLIGKEVSLVNLQNTNIINIMIGTAIVGIKFMTEKILIIQSTAEFENYL